jgi:DNA-binding MarR family transcriptional regulator
MDTANAPERLRALPSWLLGQAAVESRRVVTEVLTAEGLHRSQYALMAALEEFGPLNQTELSDRSGLDRSDVVRWVDDLVAHDLIQRNQDSGDRRRNVISMTAAGRRRLAKLDAELGRAQDELLKALSASEKAELVRLLGRVIGLQ